MISNKIRCNLKLMNQSVLAISSKHGKGKIATTFGCQKYATCKTPNEPCKEPKQTAGQKVVQWPQDACPTVAWRCECPREPQPPNYDPYRIKVPDVVVPPLPPCNAKPAIDCAKIKSPCSVQAPPPPPPCPPPPPKPFPWIYVWPIALFFTTMGTIYKLYLIKEEMEKNSDSKPIWRPRRKVKTPYHARDLPACVQYLIVGAGAASWSAYQTILEHDKSAKVFLITKEDLMPYIRPPMGKHMWFNIDPPDIKHLNYVHDGKRKTMYYQDPCSKLFMDPVKFYRKKKGPALSIARGWCVLRIEPEDHRVWIKTMCGEQPMYYERCLLAPGCKPKNLPVFDSASKGVRQKVCKLSTVRDLEIAFRKVKEARHVTIVGGGCLGTELSWYLGRMNKEVERPEDKPPVEITMVMKDKGVLAGILPEYLGEWAVEKIRAEGVTVLPKTQVYDAFESPDGRVELTLSSGKPLITDYVFVAVGSEPREEIGRHSHLEMDEINGGYLVNTELEARKHLYVAGDACSFYSQWKDTRMRCEHHMTAWEEGQIAGANMCGYWTPCNVEPHFWVRLGTELEAEVIGEVGACMPTIGIFKMCNDDDTSKKVHSEAGDGDRPCYKQAEEYKNRYKRGIVFYLREETVVGMVLWNIPPVDDRTGVVIEMLRARPSYKEINLLAELLGFPETQCVYVPDERLKDPGPCIKAIRKIKTEMEVLNRNVRR